MKNLVQSPVRLTQFELTAWAFHVLQLLTAPDEKFFNSNPLYSVWRAPHGLWAFVFVGMKGYQMLSELVYQLPNAIEDAVKDVGPILEQHRRRQNEALLLRQNERELERLEAACEREERQKSSSASTWYVQPRPRSSLDVSYDGVQRSVSMIGFDDMRELNQHRTFDFPGVALTRPERFLLMHRKCAHYLLPIPVVLVFVFPVENFLSLCENHLRKVAFPSF